MEKCFLRSVRWFKSYPPVVKTPDGSAKIKIAEAFLENPGWSTMIQFTRHWMQIWCFEIIIHKSLSLSLCFFNPTRPMFPNRETPRCLNRLAMRTELEQLPKLKKIEPRTWTSFSKICILRFQPSVSESVSGCIPATDENPANEPPCHRSPMLWRSWTPWTFDLNSMEASHGFQGGVPFEVIFNKRQQSRSVKQQMTQTHEDLTFGGFCLKFGERDDDFYTLWVSMTSWAWV